MKVLIVTYFPLPGQGGVGTYVRGLERGLARRGYEVEILAPHATLPRLCLFRSGKCVERATIEPLVYRKLRDFFGIHLTSYMESTAAQRWAGHGTLVANPPSRSISLMHFLEINRYYLEIAALYFGLQDYDLIHTQDVISSLALARVKPAQTPLVVTLHGLFARELEIQGQIPENDALQREYVRQLEQSGVSASDVCITPSQWLHGQMRQNDALRQQPFQVMTSGIDLLDFQNRLNEQPELVFDANKKNLICPARLDAVKGHHNLLNALARLKRDRQDWVCWFIGDGPMRKELEARCEDLGLSQCVRFTGMRNDVPTLLKQADVMVLASRQENQPYAVMEALIAGKPVVVTNVGGMAEIVIHEHTGLVCDVPHSDSIYLNLQRMLNDEALRRWTASNGQRFAYEQWSLDTMINRIHALYEEVLRQKRERNDATTAAVTANMSSHQGNLPHELHKQSQDRFKLVLAKPYERLFRHELQPSGIRVDRAVWDRVLQHAQPTYSLPDALVLRALGQVVHYERKKLSSAIGP